MRKWTLKMRWSLKLVFQPGHFRMASRPYTQPSLADRRKPVTSPTRCWSMARTSTRRLGATRTQRSTWWWKRATSLATFPSCWCCWKTTSTCPCGTGWGRSLSVFFFFLQLKCPSPIGFLPWENGSCTRGKPAATDSCDLIHSAFWNFHCFPSPPNSWPGLQDL